MIGSVLTIIAFYAITFGVNGGFEHSITFNGGIRISLNMPPGTGKKELETALKKAGFKDYQTRLANFKTNTYDLEFGPRVEEAIEKQIRMERKNQYRGKTPPPGRNVKNDKKNPGKKKAPETPRKADRKKESSLSKTVTGVIETKLLKHLPFISESNIISREAISASYGGKLAKTALISFLAVIAIIGLYLSFRFDLPFAIGASLALLHDIVLTVGFIGLMKVEPSIPVVAAVLTIIGYSINDTIVIFDRIRENMEGRSATALDMTMDLAITQTLSRTVITSVLTLLAVLALLFGGAVSLYDFALVLLFGVGIGTYSSIFIASHFVQYYEMLRLARRRA